MGAYLWNQVPQQASCIQTNVEKLETQSQLNLSPEILEIKSSRVEPQQDFKH